MSDGASCRVAQGSWTVWSPESRLKRRLHEMMKRMQHGKRPSGVNVVRKRGEWKASVTRNGLLRCLHPLLRLTHERPIGC